MPATDPAAILDSDVYAVTFRGNQELQRAETRLSLLALKLLVLLDGKATFAAVRERSSRFASADALADGMRELLQGGYADYASHLVIEPDNFIDFFSEQADEPPPHVLSEVHEEALAGVSTLQQDGYYVRIAMPPAVRLQQHSPDRVLVIEDEPSLAKFLRQFLEIEGFAAVTAANRDEIVTQLRRTPPPDLVLLDVMLPDVDGFNVLRKMREHPALRDVPVLMLTAKATRESVLKGLAGGANGYITKPFQPENLMAAIRTVLGRRDSPFEQRTGAQ
jgi:CheY-like chemotaxis protein